MESGLRLSAALPSPQILRLRREMARRAGFGVSVARDGSVGGIHLRRGEDLMESVTRNQQETVHAPSPATPRTLHRASTTIFGAPLGLAPRGNTDHQMLWFWA